VICDLPQQPLTTLKRLNPQLGTMSSALVAEVKTIESFVTRHEIDIRARENPFRWIGYQLLRLTNGFVIAVRMLAGVANRSKRYKNRSEDAAPTKLGNEIVKTCLVNRGRHLRMVGFGFALLPKHR